MAKGRNPEFIKVEKFINSGKGTIADYRKLNPDAPSFKVKTGSIAKGNAVVSYKKAGTFGAETKRTKGVKDSSEHLTKEQLAQSKAKAKAIRQTGKQADHIIEIQESIGYLEQLKLEKNSGVITTKQYNKELAKLRARGIGDDPKNIQALTGAENSAKQAQVAAKNRALQAMEVRNPSLRALKLTKGAKLAGKAIPYVGGAIALSSFGGSVHAMQKEGLTKKTGTDLAFRTADLALEGVDALTGGLSTPVTLALQLALAGAERTINQGAAKISTKDRKKFR